MQRYNPKEIEPKWQKQWAETKIYQAEDNSAKPKRYILEYFPYPSGAAMHVGHVRNYTIGDALSRHARMNGFNVLHPMGWDAFGLPAENYAIKTGISPQEAIKQNTGRFKQQLMQMGFGYDWSREFASSDPDYYRWTQWFFLRLYERGLAYQKESLQWWCPNDKTVLANEQVENGRCWRCGHEVEKKSLKQWFFKITDYAERLANDLDDVDWSESIKTMQRNWIGKSKGAEIQFKIDGTDKSLEVFTTRPDTLFGATFMVLAPEHPLVKQITIPKHQEAVEHYLEKVRNKSDIERQETKREKTGVFTGAYAINPINDKKIPIWVADYVLMGYGTGAIMAVPAHDERDFAFAKKLELPIRWVVNPDLIREDAKDKTKFKQKKKVVAVVENAAGDILTINWGPKLGGRLTIGGTAEGDETPEATALREVTEETGYTDLEVVAVGQESFHYKYYAFSKQEAHEADTTFVHMRLKSENRQPQNLDPEEQGKFKVEWVPRSVAETEIIEPLHRYGIEKFILGRCFHGEGIAINSGEYDGLPTSEAREKIVADLEAKGAGKERVNYKIRDWLISRQRYWGAPIPMIHCPKDGIVPVPEDQLPVVLPEIESYEPSGDGRSPLARVPEFVNTTCPKCGGKAERETDTMDGFACSSWYFLRFADPHNDKRPFDKDKVKMWLPVNAYIGGAEHAVMHLLYARMWTKVMFDEGLIEFDEPFTVLHNNGMILAPDGQKMSKSKGNTIEPDGIIDQGYGADAIRIMELFIGPWNQSANWSVEGMGGSFRFLQRVWTLVNDYINGLKYQDKDFNGELATNIRRINNRVIKQVTDDFGTLSFNTAIAALMEAINSYYKLAYVEGGTVFDPAPVAWLEGLQDLLKLLAPFAPHIAEELWRRLAAADPNANHKEIRYPERNMLRDISSPKSSIHLESWPKYDEKYLVSDRVTIVVQVNGKVRAQLELPTDADEQAVIDAAKADEKVQAHIAAKEIVKTIYVPGKILNLVVR